MALIDQDTVSGKLDCIQDFLITLLEQVNAGGTDFRIARNKTMAEGDFVDEIVIDWHTKDGKWKYVNWGMDSAGYFGQVKYPKVTND